MQGYVNKISDIDNITDQPEEHPSGVLRQATHDARTVYENGNKPKEWYEQVKRICNEVLESRGEKPEK